MYSINADPRHWESDGYPAKEWRREAWNDGINRPRSVPEKLPVRLRHLSVAVSGNIDEIERFIDPEKVDQAGFSRGSGNPSDFSLVEHGIDERRFPDIGATAKNDLR
jgi:hypothetical protein